MGKRCYGKNREAFDLVVIAGVVAEGAFVRLFARIYIPSNMYSAEAGICSPWSRHRGVKHSPTSVLLPRSSPAKAVFRQAVGTGVTAPRVVAGSAPSATATG